MICIEERVCKGCGLCVQCCPQNVLEMSARCNPKGANLPAIARPDDCNQCHLCEIICPDLAIWVLKAAASDR